jgi:hypothetical protein
LAFHSGRETDHSPPSSAEVKEWVELYLRSPICLHGVVLNEGEHMDFGVIFSIRNKEKLPQQWKESITLTIHKNVIRLFVIIIEESPSYQLSTKFYATFFWPG